MLFSTSVFLSLELSWSRTTVYVVKDLCFATRSVPFQAWSVSCFSIIGKYTATSTSFYKKFNDYSLFLSISYHITHFRNSEKHTNLSVLQTDNLLLKCPLVNTWRSMFHATVRVISVLRCVRRRNTLSAFVFLLTSQTLVFTIPSPPYRYWVGLTTRHPMRSKYHTTFSL